MEDIRNQFIRKKGAGWWVNNIQENFDEATAHLKPGIYAIEKPMGGPTMYIPVGLKDELVHFKEGVVKDILERTDKFFSEDTTTAYTEMKISQQVGMLLYGPHGTGKSCTAMVAMTQMVEKYGAICLDCDDVYVQNIIAAITEIRVNNPGVPIVIFKDEFDDAIKEQEGSWLTFLDGVNSVNKCIIIGCTNNLDKIPTRIRNRKSRVKYLFEIKKLPDTVYMDFVSKKLPGSDTKVHQEFVHWAAELSLVLDQLKHAVIDYRVDGTPIERACRQAAKIVELPVE